MADIGYTRTFTHIDWIDNQDVVQAGGDKGFNQKFHGLEAELDAISTTFGNVNTAIKTIQQINFLSAQPPTTLAANTASVEFPVEVYDRTNFPANVEKVYFAIIFPVSGSTKIRHIFLYRQAPQNKIGVTVQFFNDDAATQTQFAFRILTVATQS
jgi:hypothetical protein